MGAEQIFHADVASGEQRIRLVVSDGVDGGLAAVYQPDTKELTNLRRVPDLEEAKAVVTDWVRVVHNLRNARTDTRMAVELRAKG
jgi:hypothetical protein